jgi:3(or 17)beta-hydroxysteroid dehydrogenase
MRVQDKVALVTGGGSGIGKACSYRLAEEGAVVYVTDVNEESALDVANYITESGGKAYALQQDVCDEERWVYVVDHIVCESGKIDILVNNAGIAIVGSVEDATLHDWQRTQEVNLDSVFLGTREVIRKMKGAGGSIINISSIEGLVGEPTIAAYNASKGGVRIFTKSAALHCADKGYGIRVNSLHPGFIDTSMVDGFMAGICSSEQSQVQERIMKGIPLGKLGEPKDIANGVLFLASDEARYMTGAELVIDGGYTAR